MIKSNLLVGHVGPSIADVGGISSVIGTYQIAGPRAGMNITTIASTASSDGRVSAIWRWVASLMKAVWFCVVERGLLHVHMSQRGSLIREGSFLYLARLLQRPRVVTIHGSSFVAFGQRHPRLTRHALKSASAVLCLTEETERLVRNLLPSATVHRINNAVDIEATVVALPLTPTAVFVGEVGLRKGIDLLAAVWPGVKRSLPEAKLLVAGPTSSGATGMLADLLALPGVAYQGVLDGEGVRELLRRSSVLVLPSRAEALPRAILEAMAVGRPVIATVVGEVASLVDGSVGAVVDLDVADLTTALTTTLQDRTSATRMGEAARERIAARFSLATHLDDLRAIYVSVGA